MRIYLDTVGCRLNQAEIENMASRFRAAGHEIVGRPELADLAVANTCSVTAEAEADSRGLIRRMSRRGAGSIVATGCWATLHGIEAGALPGVRCVVPNAAKDELVADVLRIPGGSERIDGPARAPIPGARHRTRAFVKVQDGCDNRCTFCVTTIARGAGHSRALREVVLDVHAAVEGGAKEVVLTGVHLGSWGREWGMHLEGLVRGILRETDVPRVRLSSLEPWDLRPGFFELWQDNRLCKHLHLPLQSGCAGTLRRMARRTTPDSFRDLVAAARSHVPDAAITTDVIAGFPGETEDEFRASIDFVRGLEFAGGHAFTYSPMAGTAAARMPMQVPLADRRRRTRKYLEIFDRARGDFCRRFIGTEREVLWESARFEPAQTWLSSGLTDNYIRVRAQAGADRWNEFDRVRLAAGFGGGLNGIIIK